MKQIDARGRPCPVPVALVRKELPGETDLEILADSVAAVENIRRLAEKEGYRESHEAGDGFFVIRLQKDGAGGAPAAGVRAARPDTVPAGSGSVVCVTGAALGSGDPALGETLLKMFLYSLTELGRRPGILILMNGGVRFGVEDPQAARHLRALAEAGTRVVFCGACLDYYGLADRIPCGEIGNMLEIAEILTGAPSVLTL